MTDEHGHDERVEDLEPDDDEAAQVLGGAPKLPDVSLRTPPTPPGVPIPYPNTRG